ncbi:MAG TPA: hypothetical protein PKN80_08795, partial [bacterium]|nr:hypothetical protein [bacterium]
AEGETEPVSVAGGQTVKRAVAIRPPLRGIFSATYGMAGRALPEGETVYLVMSRPSERPTRHELGANISLNPAELAVQSRLGLDWVLTCKTRELASADEGAHPAPGVWNWQDERAALPASYDMKLLPCFWPGHLPTFMVDPLDTAKYRTQRGAPRASRPKLDLWAEHVGTVASHYKSLVDMWCVDDEVECSWTPDSYAPVVKTTVEAVRQAAPGVKIGLSGTAEFTEELMRYVPPEQIDFFGASAFDYYYNEAKYAGGLKAKYGKPFICYGVGGRQPDATMYHTLYTFRPPRSKAAWMARLVVYQTLLTDLDVIGHYAGVFRNDGSHLGLNKPLCDYDATPYVWGGTFGCLGTLMADAELVEEVPLGPTDRLAFIFRTGRGLGAVTYATNTPQNDMHWKPAVREFRNLSLACPAGSVEALDMYWNPLTEAKWSGGKLRFDLNEEPVFIMNKNLSETDFMDLFRKAEVDAPPVELAFEPKVDGAGRVALEVLVKNNTGRDLEGASVDFRIPSNPSASINPFNTAGAWVAPLKVSAGRIGAGQTARLTVPTAYEARLPLELGYLRGVVTASGGAEYAGEDYLWLLPAPAAAAAPKADGDLAEWEGRPAAWLAYQRHFNFSCRWEQFLEGGENFGYPSYTLDGRVAFWAAW